MDCLGSSLADNYGTHAPQIYGAHHARPHA